MGSYSKIEEKNGKNQTKWFVESGQVINQEFAGGVFNYSYVPRCFIGSGLLYDEVWNGNDSNSIKVEITSD